MFAFFTITPEMTGSVKTYIGELFTDFSPILMLIVSVLIGLAVIGAIIKMVTK
mgnify:CR=1 FL=1